MLDGCTRDGRATTVVDESTHDKAQWAWLDGKVSTGWCSPDGSPLQDGGVKSESWPAQAAVSVAAAWTG